MKILYLVNTYPSVSQTFIRREIRALECLGVEITRASIRPPEAGLVDAADLEEARRTEVLLRRGPLGLLPAVFAMLLRRPRRYCAALGAAIRLSRGSEKGFWRHLAYFGEACLLVRIAARHGVEHVHAHFATNPPLVAMLARALGGPSFSFTVHNLDDEQHGRRLKVAEKVAAARFTIVISEYGRVQVAALCAPADRERVHLVRCGLEAEDLESVVSPPSAGPDLLFVGRLCVEKQPLLLVDAARLLAARGVPFRLRIVGSGTLEDEVRTAIGAAALGDRCTLTGALDGAGVRRELEACRALVLPSRSEGLPLVLMEALARHRPVITTRVAGIPELVDDGESGWLVPSGDVTALAGAMEEALLAPPEELRRRGRAGAVKVRDQHDLARSAARLHELFQASVGRAG